MLLKESYINKGPCPHASEDLSLKSSLGDGLGTSASSNESNCRSEHESEIALRSSDIPSVPVQGSIGRESE